MKTRLACLAAMAVLPAALPAAAHAQGSITLYGVVDAGIEYLTNLPTAGGTSHDTVRMSAGNLSTSRWGLRGNEDLGGGLKAIFTLESGFDLDTANVNQGGRLFGRQAFVGLQNQYGTLSLGRHQTVLYDFSLTYDPMAVASRYSVLSHDKWLSGRADNSLKLTGQTGGLYYGLFYSTGYDSSAGGEIPGDYKAGRNWSAAVGYSAGPLSARVVYDEVRGSTVATDDNRERRATIGTAYDFARGRVFAAYRWYYGDFATSSLRTNLYWVGATYQVTPAITLTGAAYYTDVRNSSGDPYSFVLTGTYAFSKRTDLYTVLAFAKNNEGSSMGLGGFGPSLNRSATTLTATSEQVGAGQNQFGAIIGVRHRF
ncbi:Outer membrane protein (porin) [Cupriavidus sp. YR651]|uniref:porin n=1 Tax=Cupriavidus sp. YR651 TaxID=1855315 RepID=UPI00088CD21B|nr:porin [Cupriavidus sp. YR651]SDC98033.1 Outer membrane protein (porin) [Cupriavidus sp. YR651]